MSDRRHRPLRLLALASIPLGFAGLLGMQAATAPVQPAPQQVQGQATAAPASKPIPAATEALPTPRIDEVLKALPREVRDYNDHLTILASPWMDGRLPGTKGMEHAQDYMIHWFAKAGLQPAAKNTDGTPSWRQPFPLGPKKVFHDQHLSARANGKTLEFAFGKDFDMTSLGGAGDVTAPLVFVGYSIEGGKDGYETFAEGDDLFGKVAVMLRFEPMTDAGKSRWAEDGWSPAAGFAGKVAAVKKHKPAAIIVVNTPGADDSRTKSLRFAGQTMVDVPVFSMTPEAGDLLVQAADAEGRSLLDLRKIADQKGGIIDLPKATVSIGGEITETSVTTENIVGVLPGRGNLKDEVIVMGGHLDHLGMGDFGSRSGPGALHPGADDNASGSAGLLILADLLSKDYAALPPDQPLRTILFIAFSAEESGLNGSTFYTKNPLYPADKHVLMFNYDMIGRMKNDRLSVSGTGTGKGMQEWAKPFFDQAKAQYGLTVVETPGIGGGGSDHRPFYNAGVPVLFAIIADFHDDYHTPRDVSELINRESAMKAVYLFRDMALDAAKRTDRFEFASTGGPMRQQPMKVRLGARSRPLDDGSGLEVIEVTAGGSAEAAGMKVGDHLIKWNKAAVATREALVEQLRTHERGQEIQAVVVRDGQEVTLFVKLKAAEQRGQ